MTSLKEPETGNESAESCSELDDEFFAQIDQSFQVIDAWEDKDSNGAFPMPLSEVKKESEATKRSRTESDRSNASSRDSRKRETSKDRRRSRSPDRRRSPPRRFARHSPPRPRLRSPPRRRTPPSRKPRTSFLDEMQQKFPDILQNNSNNNQMQFNNMQFNGQMSQFGYPGMMPVPGPMGFPQQFPYVDNFGQPFPMNQFNNQMVNPMLVPMAPQVLSPPAPVPAPEMPTASAFPRRKKEARARQIGDNQLKEVAAASDLQTAKKKAFVEGKLTLTDMLRQMTNSKTATAADKSLKKKKVRERCKSAAILLNDLDKNQPKLPFIVCHTKTTTRPLNADEKLAWRSPLIMNDNNVQFLSQAKVTSCRDAVQANPLRNISGKLFQFSRNLGLDLQKISQDVRKARSMDEETKQFEESVAISHSVINLAARKGNRSTQTENNPCQKCLVADSKRFESKLCQVQIQNTLEATTQYEEEPGSFSVNLDARTMQTMTREQQQILVEFCRVFGLHQDRYGTAEVEPPSRWNQQDNDSNRMAYTNPDNPNVNENLFVSFSPVRRTRSRSPPLRTRSRSPARRRITERLGEKVNSPHYYNDMDPMGSRQPVFAPQIPQYRIPSPVHIRERSREHDRQSPMMSRGFRNRSRSPPPPRFNRSNSPPKGPFAHRRGRY